MNGLNQSIDDAVECPLCMEPLEVDDLTFFPCTCGYQICRFCWHRIRTDENKLCPACRKEYPENPADFKPLTQEEMIAFKSQKRQRDQQRKQKITENRKHLANVRVVQKNLVFVVGLPPRLADADILKKHEYFGKYGKIHKVVINPSTTYAGVQGPSASAYVTYVHNADALRAIQSVNNIMIDGRLIKTSLGTTKYCSHFMKNQQCPKGDCMYLHELGDPEASFTKEEMHQGKHQEYEKRLHDALIATAGVSSTTGMGSSSSGSAGTANSGSNSKANAAASMSSSSSSTASSTSSASASNAAASAASGQQPKEAWPSLSTSPVNGKEPSSGGSGSGGGNHATNGKNKKEKSRNEKNRHEKNNKSKGKSNNGPGHSNASNKENCLPDSKEGTTATADAAKSELSHRSRTERNKEKAAAAAAASSGRTKDQPQNKETVQSTQSTKVFEQAEAKRPVAASNGDAIMSPQKRPGPSNAQRTISSSSESNSDEHVSEESSRSGKSSPGDFKEEELHKDNLTTESDTEGENCGLILNAEAPVPSTAATNAVETTTTTPIAAKLELNGQTELDSPNKRDSERSRSPEQAELEPTNRDSNPAADPSAALSKLSLFDDSNSFFTSSPAFQQSLLLKNKVEPELRPNQMNSAISSHLPDLLNGIDGYQKTGNSNEWEEAFKNVMMRNNRHVEEQLLHQQHLQQQQQHHHQQVLHQQEEFLRMHELQKRNNLINNIGLSQLPGPHTDFPGNFPAPAQALLQQQQQHLLHQQQQPPQPGDNMLNHSNLFGGNMSKFFDFHKSQQQQQLHQQYLNGHSPQNGSDPRPFLENGQLNPQFMDMSISTPHLQEKQRLLGMFLAETMSQNQPQITQQQQQQTQQPNRFPQNNSIVDDDLGFDPFIETQKGLAELMENEVVQQQNLNSGNVASKLQQQAQQVSHQQLLDNMQRARMPPPGFNHMNTMGFGGANRGVQNSSKMMPFMNNGAGGGNGTTSVGPQQHQMPPLASNWNPHLAALHLNHGQPMSEPQMQHQLANAVSHNKGYSNNDWTAMDPAILSFRQFSSFPQQGQMPPIPQHQQDMFLQHLAAQQQQQQNTQGFNNPNQAQPPLLPGMNGMPGNLLNPQQQQQSSQPQVNANVQGMLEFLKNRQFV